MARRIDLRLASAHLGFGWRVACRLFWLAMLLVHAGAIASVGQSLFAQGLPSDLSALALRGFILLASALFFALKLVDVSWLRLKPGWRSSIASLVIVGLLHVGVIQRATEHALWDTPAEFVAVLSVAAVLGASRVSRRWSSRALARVRCHTSTRLTLLTVSWSRFWQEQIRPYLPPALIHSVPPRAPPAAKSL